MQRVTAVISALVLTFAFGCAPTHVTQSPGPDWKLKGAARSPADIQIVTATEFRCGGILCRLLGVAESSDADTRSRACDFTKKWFASVGNYVGFYNESNPLESSDGTPVIWIRGYDQYLSCLNVELARAGLVELALDKWEGYSFSEPQKDGDRVINWRQVLKDAKEAGRNGMAPRTMFEWPPKK